MNKKIATLIMFMLMDSPNRNNNYFYSSDWIKNCMRFEDQQFKEYFRLTKSELYVISHKIYSITDDYPSIKCLQIDLLLFLGFVGHNESYRGVRETFGIPKTTYYRKINRFTECAFKISHEFIKLPSDDELDELASEFSKGNIINIIAAFHFCL